MKKTMRLLSILLGIGAIVMFVLASVLNLSIGWVIGLVMLFVAIVATLLIAFIEYLLDGYEGNDIGSYRIPKI